MGLPTHFCQMNRSFSKGVKTLRGIHYQLPPAAEDKLVYCTQGAIFDLLVDMRNESKTFKEWCGETLTDTDRGPLFIPKGVAHGFITLEPNTEVIYLTTAPYCPELERGIRFDDPEFGFDFPANPEIFSEKSKSYPFFSPEYHLNLLGKE